ncbi:MAG: Phosphotransferase involved in threonylcarbamoyladenosine t(6)A37 formation in tRNA [Labilithrix sp.]|nr:Phosphotransferase involved in threonylcarbamoyladenosine t(6)A37 formation in tRNA [Labilithrix sp.]
MSVVRPSATTLSPSAGIVDFTPLEELVQRVFACEELAATPMPGGASTRRYYRLALPNDKSAVAMFVPEGAAPEEVQRAHDGLRWPFLEVRDLLADRGIFVPQVLAEDTAHGWLVIEDLGDDTLANWLLRNPSDKTALYTKAVTDLARAQTALAKLPKGSIVTSRTFDVELLRWELEHFKEWALDGRGKRLSPADETAFAGIADRLAQRVADLPKGFVHRDYQSRNLMVVDKGELQLVWIDFQDALLGPRVYDLVALLNDSYQEFDRAFVEARLAEYAEVAKLPAKQKKTLASEFDLVTVQRKLKDAGRFVFIDKKKANPGFLRFVTPTMKKVDAALARLEEADPDMKALRAILRRTLGDELA